MYFAIMYILHDKKEKNNYKHAIGTFEMYLVVVLWLYVKIARLSSISVNVSSSPEYNALSSACGYVTLPISFKTCANPVIEKDVLRVST